MAIAEFAGRLLAWYDRHGRHDLPWQSPRSGYRVWVAEVMLQQTQVATVLPYYQRFLAAFPDLSSLAAASEDSVLACWSGLGYYRRARHLHQAAQRCVQQHGGELPADPLALAALPGIGRSTAAAIAAQAWEQPLAILDGNVKRVLSRLYAIDGWPGQAPVEKRLWSLAQALMPNRRCADYTQAIMDFGATLCLRARPRCHDCPFALDCEARRQGRVGELPQARPARRLPQRQAWLAVLIDSAGQVQLQRREPPGVWAGLWSLPQFDSAEHLRAALPAVLAPQQGAALEPLQHAFSHYRLSLYARRFLLPGRAHRIAEDDRSGWFERADFDRIGLPAPIRRLLDSIQEIR